VITVHVAEKGAIRNYWDWFTSESDSISRDFDTYEDAEEFAKVMNSYGFDALIVSLMVSR
jgi:hypothetical protein